MTNWVDTTSYRRDEKRGVNPREWAMKGEHVHIFIHRVFGLDGWFMSTNPSMFDRQRLANADIEKAKDEAISLVRNRLSAMLAEVLP